MSNNHNIILLFSDFYKIVSINWLLLIRKSYNYEEIKNKIQIVVRNSLDPEQDPDWDFWLYPDPDSMNMDPKHC